MLKLKNLKHKIYFVDYENIHKLDLSTIDKGNSKLVIFIGVLQKYLEFDAVVKLQDIRFEIIKMSNQGKNCLDFHLCYIMGEYNKTFDKRVEFVIVSKDKGFDSVVKFSNINGRSCKRIDKI